jgi:hypothetical protein
MGWLTSVVIIFLLSSVVLAQDDEDIVVIDYKPLSFDPFKLQQAAQTIYVDLFGEQVSVDFKNFIFLGNNTTDGLVFIPTNLTKA